MEIVEFKGRLKNAQKFAAIYSTNYLTTDPLPQTHQAETQTNPESMAPCLSLQGFIRFQFISPKRK